MIDEVRFNLKAVVNSDIREHITYVFEHFVKEHDGERWTSFLIESLINDMLIVAKHYGYKFVRVIEDNILYIKVVRDETL